MTRPPEPIPVDDPRVDALRELLGVVDRLREPDGCPWDREQTEASMTPCLIEEAHELQEAIETEGDAARAAEAGDVLMNVAMICRIAEEDGRYSLADAARASSEKLIRRHPHVFGDTVVDGSGEVLRNWEAIKQAERQDADEDASAVAGVPRGLPALQRAARLADKAARVGFKWDRVAGALAKVHEELAEVEAELPDAARDAAWEPELSDTERDGLRRELGDLLLAGAILGRYLDVDPEGACRESARRFEERFRRLEEALGGSFEGLDEAALEAAWQRVK